MSTEGGCIEANGSSFEAWATSSGQVAEGTASNYRRRLSQAKRYLSEITSDTPDNLFQIFDPETIDDLYEKALKVNATKRIAGEPAIDSDITAALKKYHDFLSAQKTTRKTRALSKPKKTPCNLILYGPPGTGKTFSVAAIAWLVNQGRECTAESLHNLQPEEIATARSWYREQLQDPNGQISFTTFHQSFGYEEFVEGIRPTLSEDDDSPSTVTYTVEDGLFKTFCERARTPITLADYEINDHPTVWKVSLNGTGPNQIRTECLENGHIRIGWDSYGPVITEECDFEAYGGKNVLDAFYNKMRVGDIVLSCYSATSVDAVGVITGNPEWIKSHDTFKRQREVRWIAKGEPLEIVNRFNIPNMTLSTTYRLKIGGDKALQIAQLIDGKHVLAPQNSKPFFFVIDEINRGNISRIFGELITLIEETKREGSGDDGQSSILPYSRTKFTVPSNVYIIGTMNTADRSLTQIDTALRRRFDFWEVGPNPALLGEVPNENIDLSKMLRAMNARISVLYDRDHLIGHSYLMNIDSFDELKSRFSNKIIPLLQEYFYDDYSKICRVLNDNRENEGLIVRETSSEDYLKGFESNEFPFVVSDPSKWESSDFIRIYDDNAKENEER